MPSSGFDPESARDITRLRQAMSWSEKKLRIFREQKMRVLRQYVGANYGENGAPDRVPINMMELGVSIYARQIAAKAPQALVTSPYRDLSSGAADLELAVNYLAGQIDMESALNEAGLEALFGMGILKVGIAVQNAPADEEGYLHDAGQVFVDPVLFDDFIIDMTAKRWEQASYMGNRFRVPVEWARDNPAYDKKLRQKLSVNRGADDYERGSGDSIHPESLSQGQQPIIDEYQEYVDLIELWMPDEKLIVTLADGVDDTPLRTVDWKGPKHGPYHRLLFGKVPGNLIPLAPVQLWIDLHDAVNRLMNKTIRQAERQKTVLGVQGHAKEDGSRIVDANDGEAILTENPDGVKEFNMGGANQQTQATVIWMKDLLGYMGGNWDSIGGLASQSATAKQDQLLNDSASERVKSMQSDMTNFTKKVFTDVAYYMWNDPLINLPLTKRIDGTDLSIPVNYTSQRNMGRFFDYNFDVNPYSMPVKSPEARANAITDFVTKIMLPVAPIMAQQGISLDWEKFFKMFARYMHEYELNDLIIYSRGEQIPSRESIEPPGMPQSTTRTNVRVNAPAATRQGKDQVLASALMGVGSQPSEAAGLMRPSM